MSSDAFVTSATDLQALEADEVRDVLVEEGEPDPVSHRVTYSGTDFDVEGLVRRHDRKDIVIPSFGATDESIETAGFQRSFVWRRPQMDKFIESLLLGYPVPGIILVQQADRRYLVLDGQQRLRTLAAFYKGVHDGRVFSLQNVAEDYKGLTYSQLDNELRRTLDNTFIQATIVKTDGEPESLEAVYQIFERLNSGGTQLTPHEIRVALYAGAFIDFLTELNLNESWRELYGQLSPRLRDQEIILRFMALYTSPGDYKRPLKTYLNNFTARHRHMQILEAKRLSELFASVAGLLNAAGGHDALRIRGGALNSALTEAMMVGLARRLESSAAPSEAAVRDAIQEVLRDKNLGAAISRATADEESVRSRLAIATRAFALA